LSTSTQILELHGRAVAKKIPVFLLKVMTPDGAEEVRHWDLGLLRAGSAESNELVIKDPSVSRIHFEISAEPEGVRLRDLGSTNGTFVDGFRVLGIYLRSGSRIRLGRTEIEFHLLEQQAEVPLFDGEAFGPLIGKSAAMRELFEKLQRIARSKFTVLIEGESGTGKELIAEALHLASDRAQKPLVVFDCAATPANLMESELFGYERGAFTSAQATRPGRMEAADGGTLFLDEVGELPIDLQPKLLRAVEQRQIRRLGGDQVRNVDVRIVCATNRDLAEEVNRGAFRHDLYYRLAVVRIQVPPLRKRAEDIPLLVEHFARQVTNAATAKQFVAKLSSKGWHALGSHSWRGNLRELRNAVERTIALAGEDLPNELDLSIERRASSLSGPAALGPAASGGAQPAPAPAPGILAIDYTRPFVEQKAELVARFEEAYIRGVLDRNDGKISRASMVAGLDRMYFKRLMKKYLKSDDEP
jgi:two-component system, NtrC family, response regulator GlrR